MTKYLTAKNITIAVMAVVITIMLVFILSLPRKSKNDGPDWRQAVKGYDKALEISEEFTGYLKKNIEQREGVIDSLRMESARVLANIQTNQVKHSDNDKKLKKSNDRIGGLRLDELGREYANY